MSSIDRQIETVISEIEQSDKELNLYDELAPLYEFLYADGYDFQKQVEIVSDYIDAEDSTIVDLGCGTGELVELLAQKFHNGTHIGVDLSEPLLENARERTTDSDAVSYEKLDYRKLGELGTEVDIFTSFGSLTSHLSPTEFDKLLPMLYKMLSDEGVLIIDYHSPDKTDEDDWSDYDGNVTNWVTETDEYEIESTLITMNRGDKSEYAVGYAITETSTGETYNCSQTIPIQFYTKDDLIERLNEGGFEYVEHLPTAPDRSGTLIAHK